MTTEVFYGTPYTVVTVLLHLMFHILGEACLYSVKDQVVRT